MKHGLSKLLLAAAMAAGIASASSAQGVTDTEIKIGSNGDLSGIFASFNVQAIKAAQQIFDKVNADGGIYGRKITFIVEDHGYQMPKAMQNFNKLINYDKVFAMILNLGTPMNIAAFPLMEPKQIANISPLTAARQLLDGDITYKYAGTSSYYDQLRTAIKYLAKQKSATKVCAMYFPQDYGEEVHQGTVDAAKEDGLTYAAETTHRPDEEDFVGALTKLREAGCQIVSLGLGVRQIITVVATAKKLGWNDVSFVGCSAGMNTVIAHVPGGITEGYYAAAGWSDLENRLATTPALKTWADGYKAKFNEDPGTAAQLGYSAADQLVRALKAAGKDLTPETLQKGMESLDYYDPIMDVNVKYGPGDHQGADKIVINVVKDGVWQEVGRQ